MLIREAKQTNVKDFTIIQSSEKTSGVFNQMKVGCEHNPVFLTWIQADWETMEGKLKLVIPISILIPVIRALIRSKYGSAAVND